MYEASALCCVVCSSNPCCWGSVDLDLCLLYFLQGDYVIRETSVYQKAYGTWEVTIS